MSVVVKRFGDKSTFETLAASYPLKLLAPDIPGAVPAVAYLLTYGGGLVGGDHIDLDVAIGDHAELTLLTQGSTKVFKMRPGQSPEAQSVRTTQSLTCRIAEHGALWLLPDPVTCFKNAVYDQRQSFHLAHNSSALVLDWITSGRMSRGEQWEFHRYQSANLFYINGRQVAHDNLVLSGASAQMPLAQRLAPYSCYATVFLCGPVAAVVHQELARLSSSVQQMQLSNPPPLLWSTSTLASALVVIRVAGMETEMVRVWLGDVLVGVRADIGSQTYDRVFEV